MDEIVSEQHNYLSLITKMGVNLKKTPKSRITKGYIQIRIETLIEYWEQFKETHFKITKLSTGKERSEHVYFTQDLFYQGQEKYIEIKSEMQDILESLCSFSSLDPASGKHQKQEITLPKINIPQFGGNYQDWNTFKDLYKSLIHENSSLSSVQKLHYLKSSITGEAEQLLKHINITDKNYEIAWTTLSKRYNNKRVIVNTILNRFINQRKLNMATTNGLKEMLDTTVECLNNLKTNDVDVSGWDILIIHLLVNKLDEESRKCWEEEIGTLSIEILPTLEQFTQFLETRFRVLEMIQPSTSFRDRAFNKPRSFITTTYPHLLKCAMCNDNHLLTSCKKYNNLSVQDRVQFIQKQSLCFNCLSTKHSALYCKSRYSCQHCHKRHHSSLHFNNNEGSNYSPQPNISKEINNSNPEHESKTVVHSHFITQGHNALLATALLNVETGKGLQLVRALIDPCSQESFISENTAQRLQISRKPTSGQVIGVDQMSARIKQVTELNLHSRVNPNFNIICRAYVIKHVTDILPAQNLNLEPWVHLKNLTLADPTYTKPGPIEMLLGVNIYTEILMNGVVKGEPGTPIGQQTQFGWIISGGKVQPNRYNGIVSMHLNLNLDKLLQQFWETETIESEESDSLTPQDIRAEEIYNRTVSRDSTGRYIVALPFKRELPIIPENSKEIALRNFHYLEKQLAKNYKLRCEYNKVMEEYLILNHMEVIPSNELENKRSVYLPHHAVVREDRETTKVRVVFNASKKGINGVSLNDELLIGPKVQDELVNILLRWRMHKICFVADIVKMYRQILVRREDTDYQRILFRFNTNEPIREYRLLTVTFGTACAPYLAIKTLKQVAKDESSEDFKKVKEIVSNEFYVDDCLSGSYDIKSAIDMQKKLTAMLMNAGFELQKWSSNSEQFLTELDLKNKKTKQEVYFNKKEKTKALGVSWNVITDELSVTYEIKDLGGKHITKRNILMVIASLFDPMGWLAPTTIITKIFLQKLWRIKIGWDEILPLEYQQEWENILSAIWDVSEIKIPRWIGTTLGCVLELHGFSDASSKAYSAVIYARIANESGVDTSLLIAKTKIAPIKQISLPRLELCGAVMLSKLLKKVSRALRIDVLNTYAWCDSEITLAWIRGDPHRWKTYVRNRVLQIHETIKTNWYHVGTKENPADLPTRGVIPSKLKQNKLWWKGPPFLRERAIKLPNRDIPDVILELCETHTCALPGFKESKINECMLELLKRYSSLNKLIRIVAWIRRWLRLKEIKRLNSQGVFVSHEERTESLNCCIRLSQEIEFYEDIQQLKHEKLLKRQSRLISLTPFLDSQNLLRVGGRLQHTTAVFDIKHPIILSKKNVLLPLLLQEAHSKTLHGGPFMMISYLRRKYWLIDAVNTVKKFVQNCMTCARHRALNRRQLMGSLPECRVQPGRPFSTSGVDFAGPINVRMSKGRGSKSFKAYISLFICMVTKAVHIELVSDMTTSAFLAAYRRFTSRRGLCKEMWSDNGTTFVAASKEILQMWKQGKSCIPKELASLLDKEGTKWKFIPPGAPNFGGLWEAGVKSIKFHLKRVIGDSTLTFEELYTLLAQIEACLNSRPLSPISNHPNDLDPLTPAHFLIGEPLVTVPEKDYTDISLHNVTRWQLIQKMMQSFWKKWQSEYMSRLQTRPKWTTPKQEFDVDDLVLIKDQRCSPSKWILGRIISKHPGRDGLTRVYDVRTAAGMFTRTVTKLCALPNATKS